MISSMKRIFSDPLFAFLILSLFLFIYYSVVSDDTDRIDDTIIITDHDVDRLIDVYHRTWNAAPDSLALQRLIDQELKNEIFYNEGLKMNLDHNDEIIRRRLVQKYEFLIKDISDQTSPTETQLKDYHQLHQDQYQTAASYTLSQYYFSPDVSDDAEALAQQFYRASLAQDANQPTHSNTLHLPREQVNKSLNQLMQDFGTSFAQGIAQIVDTGWHEPIQSGYGWHVIHVRSISPPQAIPYEDIQEQVTQDYRSQQLSAYNDGLYEALQSEYDIKWDLTKYAAWVP